ncbi:galectin-related protein A-like isoform X1 [Lepidochelys kempii]|uniref:galectin-related protein A-like isoform X1 n=1 Tax=Lepidochelys kempii TaxID=8472 RepID=UPI003C6F324B
MTENDRGTNVERYIGEIKGGLKPAMKITIIGVICSNPKSEIEVGETTDSPVFLKMCFAVTLLCDPMDASKDIGLLLTVNFSEKSITRNAQIAGKWGREEKNIPYFPFTAGDTFKMELFCEHQQIRVLLDGRQLCYFTHRVQPLHLVTALQISGDIRLTKVA